MAAKMEINGKRYEVFCHIDDKGVQRQFLINPIIELCHEGKFGRAGPLSFGDPQGFREHLEHDHNINVVWANRIPHYGLRKPVVLVLMPDNTHICIDGNHRLWRVLGELLAGRQCRARGYVIDLVELETRGLCIMRPPGC